MFDLTTLVVSHIRLSLIALAAGFVVTGGLLGGRSLPGWTGFSLAVHRAATLFGGTQLLVLLVSLESG